MLESAVNKALDRYGDDLVAGLRERGYWASDVPVFPAKLRQRMRQEVEDLWEEGRFEKSQSVFGTQYYDKKNVFATEIDRGKYDTAPRLVHYTVAATQAVSARINAAFPEAHLSETHIGNKLNLCVGRGATFDAHLDVGVAEKPFNRKFTLLLYLNAAWRPELGGKLTLLGEGATEDDAALDTSNSAAGLPVHLAPAGGRWVAFWSDRMLHRVEPAHSPNDLVGEYRASYTIWFCTEDQAGSAPTAAVARAARSTDGFESAPPWARVVPP